jgi:uncharacterized protein
MKQQVLIIFFTIFFGLYFAVNYYIFIRGWQSLPNIIFVKKIYISFFILVAFAFIIGRFTDHISFTGLNHLFIWIGSFWLGAMLYFFLSVIIVDLVKILNYGFHFLPPQGTLEYTKIKSFALYTSIGIVILLLLFGYFNSNNTRIKRIEILTEKNISKSKTLKIVAVSDIHLGTLIAKKRLKKLTELVNKENPDIIILAGDILDEIQTPILIENIGEPLKELNAKKGTFAITGNHEYIGGINRAVKYIESLGIKILRDTIEDIGGTVLLIGREDRDINRFTGNHRKTKEELMLNIDTTKFLILLDHQPFELQKTADLKIDLQISGHTHHGQLWPFNYITDAVYELSYGYLRKGNTHYYVSSGFGTWGPPLRIGTRPEIVVLTIRSTHNLTDI